MLVITVFHSLVQDNFGETALAAAVNKGHLRVAKILVKNGANVNFRNKVRALIPAHTSMHDVPNDNGEPVGCTRH